MGVAGVAQVLVRVEAAAVLRQVECPSGNVLILSALLRKMAVWLMTRTRKTHRLMRRSRTGRFVVVVDVAVPMVVPVVVVIVVVVVLIVSTLAVAVGKALTLSLPRAAAVGPANTADQEVDVKKELLVEGKEWVKSFIPVLQPPGAVLERTVIVDDVDTADAEL
eukprot:3738946-Pleurochrysis_carterae.AAC.1